MRTVKWQRHMVLGVTWHSGTQTVGRYEEGMNIALTALTASTAAVSTVEGRRREKTTTCSLHREEE